MVDDNTLTNPEVSQEPQSEPEAPPIVKVPPIESRFLFVDVAALRAKQLRRGARVRLPGAEGDNPVELPRKPERVAMEEVRQGLVAYQVAEAAKAEEGEGEGQ